MPSSELPLASQPIHFAATVVPLRPAAATPEILLLQRSAALVFYGGAWVFPGGRVDPEDGDPQRELLETSKRAAVRELAEEAGLEVGPDGLVLISRWLTPPGRARRFDTLHFVAEMQPDAAVRIQASEVSDFRWITAAHALQLHAQGELELPPPTFVTLTQLAPLRSIQEVRTVLGAAPHHYIPRPHSVPGGHVYLYAGDAGYESGDLSAAGARHRLHVFDRRWHYER